MAYLPSVCLHLGYYTRFTALPAYLPVLLLLPMPRLSTATVYACYTASLPAHGCLYASPYVAFLPHRYLHLHRPTSYRLAYLVPAPNMLYSHCLTHPVCFYQRRLALFTLRHHEPSPPSTSCRDNAVNLFNTCSAAGWHLFARASRDEPEQLVYTVVTMYRTQACAWHCVSLPAGDVGMRPGRCGLRTQRLYAPRNIAIIVRRRGAWAAYTHSW